MAESTEISWADATFNGWWGCEKVSPACAHCYAETLADRFQQGIWGDGHDFRFFGDKHWNQPLNWAKKLPGKLGRRPRVFTASMADVFEERPELEEPRARLFDLISRTPELDWLVLTKRPEFMLDTLTDNTFWLDVNARRHAAGAELLGFTFGVPAPLPNLWLGTSIENARYTWRADVLRQIPAAVRFLSVEPLLGSLYPEICGATDADDSFYTQDEKTPGYIGICDSTPGHTHGHRFKSRSLAKLPLDLDGIDWVICGGESGHGARPTRVEWVREVRDECLATASCSAGECDGRGWYTGHAYECERDGICVCSGEQAQCSGDHPRTAFHLKQWGEYAPVIGHLDGLDKLYVQTPKGLERWDGHVHGATTQWGLPAMDGRGNPILRKGGKKASGRELDGRTWDEFP